MDLSDKAAKAIAKTVKCSMNNIKGVEIELVSHEDFKFEINYTITPVSALRCIEVRVPYYTARCLKGLRIRRRYFGFSNKWKVWYNFDSRSKYIIKKSGN